MSKTRFGIAIVIFSLGVPMVGYTQDRGDYASEPNFNTAIPTQSPVIDNVTAPPPSPVETQQVTPRIESTGPTADQLLAVQKPDEPAGETDDIKEGSAELKATAIEKQLPVEEATSQWQSIFIRNLVGGDGTLELISDVPDVENNMNDTVNIDQAVSLALENNPQIKAAIEGVRSKEWDRMGAYLQFLPVVQLDLAKGRERSRPGSFNDEFGNRVTDTRHDRHDRVLTVRQPLLDLGYLSDILAGHDKEDIANFEQKDVQDTIASDSVSAYMRLIQSRISIQLAEQYKGYLDELGTKMKARVEGGGASNSDLDRIISRASQAENARVEAESEYQSSLLEFQRLTGAVPLKIKVPDMLAPEFPANVEEALDAAFQQNPGYLASLKRMDVALDERNRSYSGLAPRIYAQYSSAYSYNPGGAALGNPVDGVYPTQRTDAAMLVAQWTLNGGVPVTGGLSAAARGRQASMESLDVRQKMDQSLRISYTALKTSKERLEVLQKTVEANERVITGFEEQYKNGTRSAFELLDAYEQLYNSRLNLMRVIFAYTQAAYQVRLLMGDIVPSIVSSRN